MTDELITPKEEKAIELILNAKIETDQDYIALTRLIDDEISEMNDYPQGIPKEKAEPPL